MAILQWLLMQGAWLPKTWAPEDATSLAVLIAVAAVVLTLPLALWWRTRRLSPLVFVVLLLGIRLLVGGPFHPDQTSAELTLGVLMALAGGVVIALPLLLWRRTRRFGLILAGIVVIDCISFTSYMTTVVGDIGFVLLLLALWPRWRLLYPVSRGREVAPVVSSRGALRVHTWPRSQGGFTLVSSLVGVFCLLVAFALAGQVVSSAMTAVRRANHLARATDLLSSARERTLLGQTPGDLAARAKRDLPEGTATLARTPSGPGLVQVTATARWREVDGRPGEMTLVWLTREGSR
jgi:hypothetical protein